MWSAHIILNATCLESSMGKLGAAKKAPGGKVLAGKSPRGKSPQAMRSPATNKPLGTSKGLFSFTSVADGCFIEQIVLDAYEHTIAEPATHGTDGQRH